MGRDYCEIRDWACFAPGIYKQTGEYFSPADVKAIGDNFATYSANNNPSLPVTLKLGHDRLQRYAKSLGFPSLGSVVSAHTEPDGVFVADRITGIPRIVGSAINSGLLKSGSIELPPKGAWRPPDDPAADIKGDVLSGIALLGEELPAVPGFPPPSAVFADGSPVPPLTDAETLWWLEHMAKLAEPAGNAADKDESDGGDATYAARSLCFSALTFTPESPPVDPKIEQLVALGLTPEQAQQALAICAPSAPDPTPPPQPGAVMSAEGEPKKDKDGDSDSAPAYFKAFAAECAKRMSALEAAESARKEKTEEAQMGAFAARVDAAIKEKGLAKKVPPVALPAVKDQLLGVLTGKTFAAAADRDRAFSAVLDTYAALPDSPLLKDAAADTRPAGKPGALSPFQQIMLDCEPMRRLAPGVKTYFQPAA